MHQQTLDPYQTQYALGVLQEVLLPYKSKIEGKIWRERIKQGLHCDDKTANQHIKVLRKNQCIHITSDGFVRPLKIKAGIINV